VDSKVAGKARRASLVSTFGVGSLFPTENDSVMICGLDDWSKGPVLHEQRLQDSLGVWEFRLPPTGWSRGDVPVVRFPEWAFCSQCRRLDVAWDLASRRTRICKHCNGAISPSRFVACCTKGHIEDFPYRAWVHGGHVGFEGHSLKLVTRGKSSALSDLVVKCECGKRRSMDGAFDHSALRGIKSCSGRRPWLLAAPQDPKTCDQLLRTLQRGSSNVWFASTRSAISIPSVRRRALAFVRPVLADARDDVSAEGVASLLKPPSGLTENDLIEAINELRTPAAKKTKPTEAELRAEEYRALVNGLREGQDGSREFVCTEVDLTDSGVPDVIQQVSRVSRLREVRALVGFSRVTPTTGEDPETGENRLAPLTAKDTPDWLPALEVLGEGVFVRLDEAKLTAWSQSDFALSRVRLLLESQASLPDTSLAKQMDVTARRLVLHSLAHAVLDECSLTSGYPTASLRERVYDADGQAGILIYTATADSAGSLGGLAGISDRYRFSAVLHSAIERAKWCTSDPVCIECGPSGVDGMNLCACHACLLLPETSCERFNLVLDRACLVGSPAESGDGFFHGAWAH